MKYLHSMIRVSDLEKSLHFFCDLLGLKEVRRYDSQKGKFTLVFLSDPIRFQENPKSESPVIELTYNWGSKEDYGNARNFGHLAFQVQNIYETCQKLQKAGVPILRPPRDGHMAFVKSPDQISIELLQEGENLPAQEPWQSMPNQDSW